MEYNLKTISSPTGTPIRGSPNAGTKSSLPKTSGCQTVMEMHRATGYRMIGTLKVDDSLYSMRGTGVAIGI
jgi:hypothetical protein